MRLIFWYLMIGTIVATVDITVEKLRNSQAFKDLVEHIEEQGDLCGWWIFGFITALMITWPINLTMMLHDYITTLKRRL